MNPPVILIIEDESELAKVLARFISDLAVVKLAPDLPTGLRFMREPPTPDVVLLDLKLSGSKPLNTLEHIEELKQINPDASVVVITGNLQDGLPELATKLGADFFAKKIEYATSQLSLLSAIEAGLKNVVKGKPVYERGIQILELLTEHTASLS